MRKRRIVGVTLLTVTAVILLLTWWCNYAVAHAAKNSLYTSAGDIPYNKVGLLLGTSRLDRHGYNNFFYTYRIQAALELIQQKKIKYLIISGDNSRKEYNEPEMMKADLVKAGVDSSIIYLDYAGFRTFDSIKRAKAIFGQDSLTIISQQFHNERAIYLASKEGMTAIGYNAKDVGVSHGLKTHLREKLARAKVFADYLFGAKPKFLGEKIVIPS
jgi:SanA protein